jgi:hypothetical protein
MALDGEGRDDGG